VRCAVYLPTPDFKAMNEVYAEFFGERSRRGPRGGAALPLRPRWMTRSLSAERAGGLIWEGMPATALQVSTALQSGPLTRVVIDSLRVTHADSKSVLNCNVARPPAVPRQSAFTLRAAYAYDALERN